MSVRGEEPAAAQSFLRRRDVLVLALCGVVVALLYAAFVMPDPDDATARHPAHHYYPWQAEAWLQGRLDLARPVPPELLALPDPYNPQATEHLRMGGMKGFHDLSLYQGKFYMYWGPAPVLVAFLPWRFLTGHELSASWAAWGFGCVTWLACALLVTRLVRRHFADTTIWVHAIALLGLGVCSWAPVVFFRASVWEIAIYGACCFGAITWWMLMECRWADARVKWRWLAGASLAAALAVASRPIWIAATLALAWPLWEQRKAWRTPAFRGLFVAAALPVTLGVAALLWHNHARFGAFTEFGQGYQLAAVRMQGSAMFSTTNLLFNLRQYLFAVPRLVDYFPFVLPPRISGLPAGYLGLENTYGLFVIQPWLCLAGLFVASREAVRQLAPVLVGFVMLFGLLLLFSGAALRYELEVATPLCVLAAAGLVSFRRPARLPATLGGGVAVFLLIISGVGAFLVQSRMVIAELKQPAPHPILGRLANHLAGAIGYAARGGTYAVEMDVVFPAQGTTTGNSAQALITSGGVPTVDGVLVDYPDGDHVRFHYYHDTILGTTPGLALARGTPHRVRIEFGALLPPANHPFWGELPAAEIEKRRSQIAVTCNGQPIFSGPVPVYPSANAAPTVGHVDTVEGPQLRFTGQINNVKLLRVERL